LACKNEPLLLVLGKVYINYPEPPASHDEDKVPEHLLDAVFFANLHRVLVTDGRVTVVRELLSVSFPYPRRHPSPLLCSQR
jgi:hypothetical protein